jgi:hypothetical protein
MLQLTPDFWTGRPSLTDPACAPFMAEIGEIFSMGHFAEERRA